MPTRGFRAGRLTVDFKVNPIGIGEEAPLLGWQLLSDRMGAAQSACRVVVARTAEGLGDPDLWDSGKLATDAPALCYAGRPLASGERAHWRVMVWDESGEGGEWSDPASFKQGIREPDWRGEWIGFDEGRDAYDPSVPYYCADEFDRGENHPFLPPPAQLRTEFTLGAGVRCATLYVAAMGLAEVHLNGRKATTDHMVPGVCDYRKRCYYRAYDVTRLLRPGENAIGAVLADGWYAGYIGLNPREWWGRYPRLNLHLAVEYEDGSAQTLGTHPDWRAAQGPWRYADILHGAGYDRTREAPGWA